jgi:hypothetical protein
MLDRKPVSARYCSRMKLAHPTYLYVLAHPTYLYVLAHPTYLYVVDVEGAESLTI